MREKSLEAAANEYAAKVREFDGPLEAQYSRCGFEAGAKWALEEAADIAFKLGGEMSNSSALVVALNIDKAIRALKESK